MNLDIYFFNLIHGLAGKWLLLDTLGVFFAQYFEYLLWLAIILYLAWLFFHDRGNFAALKKPFKILFLAFFSAVISRFALAEIIRWIWFRPRPFLTFNFIPLIHQSAAEASFPSGHASFYFALSTIVYFYNKKAGILFYVASFLIVLARVFVGIHWPSDILAGAVLGILTAGL